MDSGKLFAFASAFEKLAKKPGGWKKKPPGWTEKSVDQYAKTMMKGKKHPFTSCVNKMEGKIKSPEGFCASLRDRNEKSTRWRSSDRKKE